MRDELEELRQEVERLKRCNEQLGRSHASQINRWMQDCRELRDIMDRQKIRSSELREEIYQLREILRRWRDRTGVMGTHRSCHCHACAELHDLLE